MIENLIGYTFKNKKFLNQALTHPSYKESQFQSLEFLGDRILGMVIADIIFKNKTNIKCMAGEFSNLVNTNALYEISKLWQIDKYLKHDIQNLSKKVLADTVEALFAAIYLDSDFKSISLIIQNLYKNFLKKFKSTIEPKMYLQELAQANNLSLPKYIIISEKGEEHLKEYMVKVQVEKFGSAIGVGNSKQEASKNAASNLIKLIHEKT